jgi:hypothetical protein
MANNTQIDTLSVLLSLSLSLKLARTPKGGRCDDNKVQPNQRLHEMNSDKLLSISAIWTSASSVFVVSQILHIIKQT